MSARIPEDGDGTHISLPFLKHCEEEGPKILDVMLPLCSTKEDFKEAIEDVKRNYKMFLGIQIQESRNEIHRQNIVTAYEPDPSTSVGEIRGAVYHMEKNLFQTSNEYDAEFKEIMENPYTFDIDSRYQAFVTKLEEIAQRHHEHYTTLPHREKVKNIAFGVELDD